MLEVCIDSFESAMNAALGGADELEVCSCLSQGGLTPSAGLVSRIIRELDQAVTKSKLSFRPKINVMIRCRPGSDFCYTDDEMATMLEDIDVFKKMAVDRFVFGSLTAGREIDTGNCHKVIARAKPLPVTFHRAFDLCRDPIGGIDCISDMGFSRLLTSGQMSSAAHKDALSLIKNLLKQCNSNRSDIEVMPGSGVTPDNVQEFMKLGCKIVHSSCKKVRILNKFDNDLNMGDLDSVFVTDKKVVQDMKGQMERPGVCVGFLAFDC